MSEPTISVIYRRWSDAYPTAQFIIHLDEDSADEIAKYMSAREDKVYGEDAYYVGSLPIVEEPIPIDIRAGRQHYMVHFDHHVPIAYPAVTDLIANAGVYLSRISEPGSVCGNVFVWAHTEEEAIKRAWDILGGTI